MSTSLLYQAFGIRGGYEHVRTDFAESRVIFSIRQLREKLRCSRCGSPRVHVKTHEHRAFRSLPIGGRAVWIHLPVARVACQHCRAVRQVKIGFADPRVSYTRAFERHALELLRFGTIRDVADHLQVSWDLIKGIQKRALRRKFAKPKLQHLKRIAIDEIHLGKRLKFLTIVLDRDSGAIVFVGQGKGAEALDPFWKRLRPSRAKIEAVAADGHRPKGGPPAYALAVRENLPEAALVNDRFHVIKLYNEMLTELRRELYREATDQLHQDVLKGTRWLLLKRMDNLADRRREPERLLAALKLNESLAIAYYLKEDLDQFWEQPSKTAAERFLDDWIAAAMNTGIRLVMKFAKTLAARRSTLLNWYDYPISTGPLEAVNNKIRLLHRQAFGYREAEFFQLKLYALHQARYALVG